MLPVLAASCGCARASVSHLQTHSCLWLQARGVTCGSSEGAGCWVLSLQQGADQEAQGGRERACTAPGSLSPHSFVLWGCFLQTDPCLTCPSPFCHASSLPAPEAGTEAAVWGPWSCPPLQAQPALVLQSFLTGKCSSHSRVGLPLLSCCDLSKFPTRNRPQAGLSGLMAAE